MSQMILLISLCIVERIVRKSIQTVLDILVPRNLVRAYAVEEFVLLPERKAVRVDPGAPEALKGPVEILLVVLRAADEVHVGELRDLLAAGGVDDAGEDSHSVAMALE